MLYFNFIENLVRELKRRCWSNTASNSETNIVNSNCNKDVPEAQNEGTENGDSTDN